MPQDKCALKRAEVSKHWEPCTILILVDSMTIASKSAPKKVDPEKYVLKKMWIVQLCARRIGLLGSSEPPDKWSKEHIRNR